ncbi:hypothetical protein MNBD_NITROSPINAE02-1274 [hydrothermal vent metagenome]|uniref:PilZ domain-containing protein n=1 Tax=hydrothermal vent metagenome TaxID=652676 RepID=A0A3B1BIG0_9ZZZZ
MDNEETNRRRKRVHFETKITLLFEQKEYVFQRTFDVSMNGIFVKTVKPLPMGAIMPFKMTLSVGMRREEVKGRCEVVRIVSLDDGLSDSERGAGMGLSFIEIDPDSSEILYNIVRYNQPPEQR